MRHLAITVALLAAALPRPSEPPVLPVPGLPKQVECWVYRGNLCWDVDEWPPPSWKRRRRR